MLINSIVSKDLRSYFLSFVIFVLVGMLLTPDRSNAQLKAPPTKPNILFVIMDDVGIDQMKAFGYGGVNPPKAPNINMLAQSGVRFRNTWSMPECSPSRAVFFTGRFPLRTNIFQAIGQNDLANSQVSPYEMTVPRVLKTRGYSSAMFGKFHLGGPENNPLGHGTPAALGFDYYYGFLAGDPASLDTTAGGVAASGTYACGFVQGAAAGACRFANGLCDAEAATGSPGKRCIERGGIFVPNSTCDAAASLPLNFNLQNAHYVSPIVINQSNGAVTEVPLTDPSARNYRATTEVNAARDWINERPRNKPWMATLSFSGDHTPYQCPPDSLLSNKSRAINNSLDCSNSLEQRLVSDRVIEAMDTEFGRLLTQTGLARGSKSGKLSLTDKGKNTMIVLAGDNGSFGPSTKLPFDGNRAKGTVYQTGVWVPLVVTGPFVQNKDRDVNHMINIADVFELFGEIAGAKVHKLVPRELDSRPMLAYLKNPKQKSIRKINFTQFGLNIQANRFGNEPCVFGGSSCSQTPISKSVCEDNGGVWWGQGADDPSTAIVGTAGVSNCCEVNKALINNNQPAIAIFPDGTATRDERYKLVRNSTNDYDPATQACVTTDTVEFYEINQAKNNPKLDREGTQLALDSLTPKQQKSFNALSKGMDAILASEVVCPGDGNIDGVVNQKDIDDYQATIAKAAEDLDEDPQWNSSVFDFNYDGMTDQNDLAVIQANLGKQC